VRYSKRVRDKNESPQNISFGVIRFLLVMLISRISGKT
jgi:hypothetical protein